MSNFIDMTGQQFERLTVIGLDTKRREQAKAEGKRARSWWLCECDCKEHKVVSVDRCALIEGRQKSCGCIQKEKALARMKEIGKNTIKDEIGNTYSLLTVLEQDHSKKSKCGNVYWICQCSCEDRTVLSVSGSQLRRGHTKSCGCLKRKHIQELGYSNTIDITGNVYGNLKVLEIAKDEQLKRQSKEILWKCECLLDGNIVYVRGSNLKNGHTVSCGCINSKGNQQISAFLLRNGIRFNSEYSFSDLQDKGPLYFDFAIFNEERMICLIEYHGIQHYEPVDFFGGQDQFVLQQKHDEMKRKYCLDKNIPLYEISYLNDMENNLGKILMKIREEYIEELKEK